MKIRLRPQVVIRVVVAVLLVGLTGNYLYNRFMTYSSVDGVVTAPLTPIRAPIEGLVYLDSDAQPGGSVAMGTKLFSVVDDRVDARIASDLRARHVSLREAIKLLDEKIAAVREVVSGLVLRVAVHREATTIRLQALIDEAAASVDGAQAKSVQTDGEFARAQELFKRGFATKAKLDETLATKTSARADIVRGKATVRKLRMELETARQGVVIGEGYGDAPYSFQRIDELRMRLMDLQSERAAAQSSERELSARMTAEDLRIEQLTRSIVQSSTRGVLWNVRVGEGAWVSRGEALADFADCSQPYVEASLPDRGFLSIRPGDGVAVRLSGSSNDVEGVVRSVRGSGPANAGSFKTSGVERQATGMMTVVVAVTADVFGAGECQLGRTAKVYFHDSNGRVQQPRRASALALQEAPDTADWLSGTGPGAGDGLRRSQ